MNLQHFEFVDSAAVGLDFRVHHFQIVDYRVHHFQIVLFRVRSHLNGTDKLFVDINGFFDISAIMNSVPRRLDSVQCSEITACATLSAVQCCADGCLTWQLLHVARLQKKCPLGPRNSPPSSDCRTQHAIPALFLMVQGCLCGGRFRLLLRRQCHADLNCTGSTTHISSRHKALESRHRWFHPSRRGI